MHLHVSLTSMRVNKFLRMEGSVMPSSLARASSNLSEGSRAIISLALLALPSGSGAPALRARSMES